MVFSFTTKFDLYQFGRNQIFSNLYGVCRRSFSQVVRNNPHIQGVFLAFVTTNSTYKNSIFSLCIHWHWVGKSVVIVLNYDAIRMMQNASYLIYIKIIREFYVHSFTMSAYNGYTNRSSRNGNSVVGLIFFWFHEPVSSLL